VNVKPLFYLSAVIHRRRRAMVKPLKRNMKTIEQRIGIHFFCMPSFA
jgi:hypothetical protein